MSIANDSVERPAALENTCETLWDRVLRICDQWFPTNESNLVRQKRAYSLNGVAVLK
jgi:hypothetical protein